jgi:hypothetical protein
VVTLTDIDCNFSEFSDDFILVNRDRGSERDFRAAETEPKRLIAN